MKDLIEKLNNYGQTHLISFFDGLSENEKEHLISDINNIDFELMKNLYQNAEIVPKDFSSENIAPIPVKKACDEFAAVGLDAISKGEVAAITMAGGQGSRLGHVGPKGTFDIGLASHKSLFEIQCDGLKKLYQETGFYVHWYIMTSSINDSETREFFKKNDYFGYPEEKIGFFPQGDLPALDKDGKILLSSKSEVVKAPDGNGGIFAAMKKYGVLDTLEKENVKYVFVCGIDNCLVKMCDRNFVGCIKLTGKDVATKTFLKRSADEKAGVFALVNGKPAVLEYTEIPAEIAEKKDDNGEFVYGDANVLNYIFRLDSLKNALDKGLPYHTAIKKINHIGENGDIVIPSVPDSYKFELFMFDIFEYLNDIVAFRINRDEEFAPVKNKEGLDSPITARRLYMRENKIKMMNPIVEMDGDEMTRIIWQKIKEKVILPYIDLNTEYYDLSIQNRDMTDDLVTVASANAVKKHKIAVKCATITPNAARVTEYGLKKMYKSPNGTIRSILGGTVFRSPIIVDGVEPVVKNWKKPITIARHAYGDIYSAVEAKVPAGSVAKLVIEKPDGTVEEKIIHEYKNSDGVVLGQHNRVESIEGFAKACFEYALSVKQDLWFSSKDTISKIYDHTFKDVFQELYDNVYKTRFEEAGIKYFYTLVDDAISRVMKSEGGFVWATKNYDGDVFSDMLASAFGSLSMMTSVLCSPDGYFEYEAAHGTIPRHYHRYLAGEKTSTNPIATLYAWTGALRKRGEMDGNDDLIDFADRTEKTCEKLISNGFMTGDLALITTKDKETVKVLSLDEFLDKVSENIYNN